MKHVWALMQGLVVLATASAAADYHQITTQEQFVEEMVDKPIQNEDLRKVFSHDRRFSGETIARAPLRQNPGPALRYFYGTWEWKETSLCIRDEATGSMALHDPCWAVLISGDSILFVSKRGQGETVDLYTFYK